MASSPGSVELRFDEAVETALGGIKVLRPDGSRADRGRAVLRDGNRTLRVGIDAEALGTYTVAWRVVSADNHPISGSFLFSVRTRSTVGPSTGDETPSAGRGLSATGRFSAYAFTLALLGMVLLRRFASPTDETEGVVARRLRSTTHLLALAAFVAVVVALVGQMSVASGRSPLDAVELLPETIRSTRLGLAAVVRAAGALLVIAPRWVRRPAAADGAALIGGAVALLAPALVGHASTAPLAAVAVGADVTHLLAASVWVGGLAAIVVAGRAGRSVAESFARFALPAAVVVVASGTLSAWLQARSISALTDTSWGRLIGLKAAGFVLLLILGFVNRRRVLPVAERFRTLLELVKVELGIVGAVLIATTLVTNRAPARVEFTRPISAEVPSPDGGLLSMTVAPARVGINELHLYFLDQNGLQRPVDAVEVTVAIGDIPPRKVALTPVTASHYSDYGLVLPSPGKWVLSVTSVTRGTPATTRLELPVR